MIHYIFIYKIGNLFYLSRVAAKKPHKTFDFSYIFLMLQVHTSMGIF